MYRRRRHPHRRPHVKRFCLAVAVAGTAGLFLHPVSFAQSARPAFTIDSLIDIMHPSAPVWSRDSKRVAFMWERAGVANLYVVAADGSGRPSPLTTDGAPVGNVFWSA